MRPRSLAPLVASFLVLTVVGCSTSDSASTRTSFGSSGSSISDASTPTASGPTLLPGIVPAAVAEIAAAPDVRALLASVGFPVAWPMPDDLVAADVLGMVASQTTTDARTDATFSLTWRLPTGDVDSTAKQWFATADAALGVGPQTGTSAVGSGSQAGVSRSGGSDGDPFGRLKVTVSPADATSIAVQVEYEVVVAGVPTLRFAPSTLAALPSIVGCVPELVQASFVRYDAPNASHGERDFIRIFQATCPSRAAFDATVSWAVGRDGRVTQNGDSIEVTGSTGPDGESLHVGASAAGSLRVDTTAAVPVG